MRGRRVEAAGVAMQFMDLTTTCADLVAIAAILRSLKLPTLGISPTPTPRLFVAGVSHTPHVSHPYSHTPWATAALRSPVSCARRASRGACSAAAAADDSKSCRFCSVRSRTCVCVNVCGDREQGGGSSPVADTI
eukprot:149582-Chlamydomonas_euryale.AAC.1